MEFQGVKGTRDFYPDDMRIRNWIVEAWRRVSLRNGFEEYDSPIFEYLDLFTAKSGEGIVSELFSLTDRGGRNLALRAEMTPSLARMVNARIESLPRPIKWFSIGRCCRAEKPQKGRTREFFQWNADVIGEESTLADAECVLVCVDLLREVGLTPGDVVIRYSSKELLSEVLASLGLSRADMPAAMAVLDKRQNLPQEAFDELFQRAVPDEQARTGALRFLDASDTAADPDSVARSAATKPTREIAEAIGRLQQFQRQLAAFGVSEWCRYDAGIIRGLAYYTGIVYEVFDAERSLRAIGGGGRYDGLLEGLGGPKVAATGFGMGDVVLGILLEEKGRLPDLAGAIEFFVIDDGDGQLADVIKVVAELRKAGRSADFSYARKPLGKQLKEANRRQARKAVIVRSGGVSVKDLTAGSQEDASLSGFLAACAPGAS